MAVGLRQQTERAQHARLTVEHNVAAAEQLSRERCFEYRAALHRNAAVVADQPTDATKALNFQAACGREDEMRVVAERKCRDFYAEKRNHDAGVVDYRTAVEQHLALRN